MKLRSVLAIVFLAIGAIALGLGVSSLFKSDPGWAVIEVNSSELNCSGEFVFNYCLGMSDLSASTEKREVYAVYSSATASAYKIFNENTEIAGVANIYTLNANVNKPTEIDPVLYKAFERINSKNNRILFSSAVYAEYKREFFGYDTSPALAESDPYTNTEKAEFFKEIAGFVSQEKHISIEFLGNNTVKLNVSAEYLAFAKENEMENFIGLSWFKNAVVVDYLAEMLISAGYRYGNITSTDGFGRNLYNIGSESYSLNIFNRVGKEIYVSANMTYKAPAAVVTLRDYPLAENDKLKFFTKSNGESITPYIDLTDGLYRSAVDTLTLYSTSSESCVDILLEAIPVYISDTLDTDALKKLADKGVHSVWTDDNVVLYTEKALVINTVSDEKKSYTKAYAFD